jgi:quercetin dioxygenase-like cupin family protein
LTFQFGEGDIELAEGDSICFPASKGHRVVNNTTEVAVANWLTVHTGSEIPEVTVAAKSS